MKHSHISRHYAKAFFAFATLALAGACSDSSVAPTAETPAFVAPANFVSVGSAVSFRVDNAQGITKRIGNHLINIPAGAICDLATSGYGASMWDKSCTPQRGSVVITATVMEGPNGEPYVDFQPAMRFAPNKEVMLFMRVDRNSAGKYLSVKYCNNVGYCVDESLTDASLKPFRVGKSHILGRRIKHFSGYTISTDECTSMGGIPVVTPEGIWCETGGGNERRSGYMVASGEDVTDAMKEDKKEGKKDDAQ